MTMSEAPRWSAAREAMVVKMTFGSPRGRLRMIVAASQVPWPPPIREYPSDLTARNGGSKDLGRADRDACHRVTLRLNLQLAQAVTGRHSDEIPVDVCSSSAATRRSRISTNHGVHPFERMRSAA